MTKKTQISKTSIDEQIGCDTVTSDQSTTDILAMSNDVQSVVEVIMMSKFRLTCALLSLAAVILVGCDTTPQSLAPNPTFKIDHYKFYDIKTRTTIAKVPVQLNDQFHEKKPLVATVASPNFFGNPVIKTKKGEKEGKFKNPMAHLTWYELETKTSEPRRTLQLTNQFGQQTVKIGSASVLLAPSLKSEEGKDIPKGKDLPKNVGHYVGYIILKPVWPFKGPLKLRDQFGTDPNAKIRQAAYLFVPADKTLNGKRFKRVHAEDHLVAFQLERADVPNNAKRQTKDQFITLRLDFLSPKYLAVPTKKKPVNRTRCSD